MRAASVPCIILASWTLLGSGCHREPASSSRHDACSATCASVACLNPDLDTNAISRCETYCIDKFEASEEQGLECQTAYEESMTCLAELSCTEYESWLAATPDSPCPEARGKVEAACEQIFL